MRVGVAAIVRAIGLPFHVSIRGAVVLLSQCQIQKIWELSRGGGRYTNGSSSALLGTDVGVGRPCEGSLVSPGLSELPTELKVLADVEVSEGLCPPDD